eukprot:s23_g48.t1
MEVRFASSGAIAAQLALQEFEGKTTKEVKQRLADRLGTSRHRVRLLDHEVMPDDQVFEAQTSVLQLVLVPSRQWECKMVQQMLTAVYDDDVSALERLLDLPLDPCKMVQQMLTAVYDDDVSALERLLDLPLDPSAFILPHWKTEESWRRPVEDPLIAAIKRERVACVKLLLNAHATVNTTLRPDPPLSMAACCGNATLVGLLLEARARTELRGQNNPTALMLASCNGTLRSLPNSWLRARAGADLTTDDGDRPLMRAAQKSRLEVSRLLIAAGADVNYMWQAQYTALWFAVRARNVDLARLLVD